MMMESIWNQGRRRIRSFVSTGWNLDISSCHCNHHNHHYHYHGLHPQRQRRMASSSLLWSSSTTTWPRDSRIRKNATMWKTEEKGLAQPRIMPIIMPTVTTTLYDQRNTFTARAKRAPLKPVWTPPKAQKIPSNLIIDPRSKYAPVRASALADEDDDDDDETEIGKPKRKEDVTASEMEQEDEGDTEEDEDDEEEEEDDYDDVRDDDDDELFIPAMKVKYAVPLPERLHVPVYSLFAPVADSQVGTIWLHENAFGRETIRVDLLKRAVNYIRAKKRGKRTAKVKTVSLVRGSGRKLRPQKGMGRARVGHGRPPHFRGGARVKGPMGLTDYGKTKLNKKVRRLAMSHALSQKLLEGNLIILNTCYDLPTPKTRELARYLKAWGIGGKDGKSALIADFYMPPQMGEVQYGPDGGPIQSYRGTPVNFWCASSNIPHVTFGSAGFVNVYRILRHEKLILTLSAVENFERKLKRFD